MRIRRFLFKFCLTFALILAVAAPSIAGEVEGGLLWSKKFGSGYAAAPSAILAEGDCLYTMVGKKLYRLDRFSGEITGVSSEAAASAGYGINPPSSGGGMIFVPIKGGRVQAFDALTLEPLWSTPALGGQSLTPVCYSEGKIYFGTWTAESEPGYYCGFKADKSGCSQLWKLEHKGGFYRAGALARGGEVVFGSEDGEEGDSKASAVLYRVDAQSGEVLEKIENIEGDIRSSVIEYNGGYVFSTKGGYVYRVKDGSVSKVKVGPSCASTPAVAQGKAYVGTSDKYLAVVDLENAVLDRKIKAEGYPNGGAAVMGGRVYVTCNSLPGGVFCTDVDGVKLDPVFMPQGEMAQYCISPIAFADDGTLYYKNDSGYIFAVALSVSADVYVPERTEAVLITSGEKVSLKRLVLEEGKNTLKLPALGGKAFVWTQWLQPLSEKITI